MSQTNGIQGVVAATGSRRPKRRRAPGPRSAAGFTLIELMVTISIFAILATLALPSFLQTIRENRIATEANKLLTLLTLARSESIKRNVPVGLCTTADGASCSGTAAWNEGVLVYVDTNGDGKYDDTATGAAEEPLVAVEFPMSFSSAIGSNLGTALSYSPDGRASATGTFTFTPVGETAATRKLTIAWTGRASVCQTSGGC